MTLVKGTVTGSDLFTDNWQTLCPNLTNFRLKADLDRSN